MRGEIDSPVFLIGTGRCGLTLLMDLVAWHEDVAWLSQYTEKWPTSSLAASVPYWWNKPVLRRLMHIITGVTGKQWWRPRTEEGYKAFHSRFSGWETCRPLSPLDVTHTAREGIRDLLVQHIRGQRKKRFVTDTSGYPRVRFLSEIFPDALFVFVVRDMRATVNSFLNVDWWRGWHGEWRWAWAPIPDKYRESVYNDRPSFAALAAVNVCMTLDDLVEQTLELDSHRCMKMRFEDLTKDTEGKLREFCAFTGLPYTQCFDRTWRRIRVFDPNNKKMRIAPWRENLTEEQQRTVTEICRPYLVKYGYLEENT